MDVMVAMKDSCELLSGLFWDFHNDSDSTFYADTDIDQSGHSDGEHDSNLGGSLDSEEEGEAMEDAIYLQGVRDSNDAVVEAIDMVMDDTLDGDSTFDSISH